MPRRLALAMMLMTLLAGPASGLAAARSSVGYGPTLARATMDRPDDARKAQIHLVYAVPSDAADRELDTDGTLRNSVSSFQSWLAAQTGGKALRLDTFQGSLDISFFRLSQTDEAIAGYGPFVREHLEAELSAAGFDAPNKIYAVYYDGTSSHSCGAGAWPPTIVGSVAAMYLRGLPDATVPCASNAFANEGAPPAYLEFGMLHEILHTLGFVPTCAPHHWRAGHVSDDPNDLMWAGDGNWAPDGWESVVLDAGNDDYYRVRGGGCLDFARSRYLSRY